jgi:deferrochelatase/peroxidase EfeB
MGQSEGMEKRQRSQGNRELRHGKIPKNKHKITRRTSNYLTMTDIGSDVYTSAVSRTAVTMFVQKIRMISQRNSQNLEPCADWFRSNPLTEPISLLLLFQVLF